MATQDADFEVNYVAPVMPPEARRAVALGEAVKLGVRQGWGEDSVLAAAAHFDTFLEGSGGDE